MPGWKLECINIFFGMWKIDYIFKLLNINLIVWETVTLSNHIQVDVYQISPLSYFIDINF